MPDGTIRIVQTLPAYAEGLAALQALCFPGLPESDLFTAEQYRSHIAIFPDGQFTALAEGPEGTRIVGATTTMRTHFEAVPPHFMEFIGHGWLHTHEPDGRWLYGIDMSVHPEFRRQGISRLFYRERADLVQRLGLRGEIVAGLIPGYAVHADRLSPEGYVAEVAAGKLTDPTLTPQLRNGFRVQRLLYGYVTDSRSRNVSTLLIREAGS